MRHKRSGRVRPVQLINAVVRPSKVGEVCEALQSFGFHGLTVTPANGYGKQRGPVEIYRGVTSSADFKEQAKIEVVARDEDVQDLIDVICKVAATGHTGDGKIWVTPVGELVRIRTREQGADALE
jgi:nitrogen regulatory protein P-II 1